MKSLTGEVKSSAMWSAPWMTVTVLWSSSCSTGNPPVKTRRGLASVFNHWILVTGRQRPSPMRQRRGVRDEGGEDGGVRNGRWEGVSVCVCVCMRQL